MFDFQPIFFLEILNKPYLERLRESKLVEIAGHNSSLLAETKNARKGVCIGSSLFLLSRNKKAGWLPVFQNIEDVSLLRLVNLSRFN
jgi:hypothetical protein